MNCKPSWVLQKQNSQSNVKNNFYCASEQVATCLENHLAEPSVYGCGKLFSFFSEPREKETTRYTNIQFVEDVVLNFDPENSVSLMEEKNLNF